jgi:diguanylate cyclase (GGDEF)-like protein
MTVHDLVGYPLVAVSLVELLLGVVLLRGGAGDRVRRAAAVLSLTLAAYALTAGLAYAAWEQSRATAGVFYRLAWSGWLGIPAGLYLLHALHHPHGPQGPHGPRGPRGPRGRGVVVALSAFWVVALALALTTDLVELPPAALIPYVDVRAPLESVLRLAGALQLVYLMVVILRVHRRSRGQERLQLAYLLLGLFVMALGGAVTAAVLPLADMPALDPALGSGFALPSVVLTFVAITRRRLFDLATLLSRALGLLTLLLVFGALQVALFLALEQVLVPVGAVALSFAVTATLLLGTPLRRWLQVGVRGLVRRGRDRHHALLLESARKLVTLLEPEEVVQHLSRLVSTGLGAGSVAVYAATEDGTLVLRRIAGGPVGAGPEVLTPPILDGIVAAGRAVVPLPAPAGYGPGPLAVLLRYQEAVHGVVLVGPRRDGSAWVDEDYGVLETLGSHAAVALANARLYREATTDDLTGLTHRKHFLRRLEEEQARARLADQSLAVLMIDVDRFKRVNDTYGHPVGDRVLKGVAWTILRAVRHPDVASRFGGEEFAVLLCGTNLAGAQSVAERIREAVEGERYARGSAVTVSVGVALHRPAAESLAVGDVIAAADAALYDAKRGGRNRVCVATGVRCVAASSGEIPRFLPAGAPMDASFP